MLRREVLSLFGTGASSVVGASFPFASHRLMAQGALRKIRVNKVPVADFVTVDLALSKGWFKDEGLDVSIEAVAVGAVAMQALVAGKLDVIWTSLDNCVKARAQGFDLVIVSGMVRVQQKPPASTAILVKKDSGITSAKALEGKRVVVGNLQGIDWAFAREFVVKGGGDPNKVHFLEVPFPQLVEFGLERSGRRGAASRAVHLDRAGYWQTCRAGLSVCGPPAGPQPRRLVRTASWVKDNAQAVASFRRVLQKGIDFLQQNPDEKAKAILQFTTLKPELLSRITLNEWSTQIDLIDLQKQVEVYHRQGMIDKPFDAAIMLTQ